MGRYDKIVLTGADGFLGTHVGRLLRKENIKFRAIAGKDLDITKGPDVLRELRGVGCIIHLAGKVISNPSDSAPLYFDINAKGTLNVLEAARVNRIKKIILASTVEVYSRFLPSGLIDESSPLAPLSYYGMSKLLAEKYCEQYAEKFNFDCFILRFCYLYGSGMKSTRVFAKLRQAAIEQKNIELEIDNNEFFDVLYIKDAAEAVVKSLKSDRSGIYNLNISSGIKTRLKDVVNFIQAMHSDFLIKYRSKVGHKNFYYYSPKRAKNFIDFKPHYGLREGIRDFLSEAI